MCGKVKLKGIYNNKYNQKLPYFYFMTKWMVNNYFFVIKSVYSAFTC